MYSKFLKILITTTITVGYSFASCTIVVRDNTPANIFAQKKFVRAESSGLGLIILKCDKNGTSTIENCSSGLYGTPSRLLYTYLQDFDDCKGSVNTDIGLSIDNEDDNYYLAHITS